MTTETARITSEIEAERAKLRDLRTRLNGDDDALADVQAADFMLHVAADRLSDGEDIRSMSALSSAVAMRKAAETRKTGGAS